MSQLTLLILATTLTLAVTTDGNASTPEAATNTASDFRIDNAVYIGDAKEPVCRSSTIFREGVVYDCMKSPPETIVFDMTSGRFALLDLDRRTRTDLTTGMVEDFTHELQRVAVKSEDPVIKFLAAPGFQEQFDAASGSLALTSPLVEYRLALRPEYDPSVLTQYHEFSDWYARLNAMLPPGTRPPFGRLVVNAAVAKRNSTADKVVLTLAPNSSDKPPVKIRSEHRLVRPLTKVDLQRVAQAKKQMVGFKSIRFVEYRKADFRRR